MVVRMLVILSFILSIIGVLGKPGFGPTDQEWGYVDVRSGAHMFWWLHYTTSEVPDRTTRPLVIWLQGGPGASSTGYGNFGEIGPLDEHLNEREHAWTKKYNVLFVDNPVGTGFSYVDDVSDLATNNSQIASDFLVLLQDVYRKLPEFNNTPLYIFSESYGGKMTAEIGLVLYQAQKNGEISSNLRGVALGDAWISPEDSVLTWGPYLLNQGLVDDSGFDIIQKAAMDVVDSISNGDYMKATDLWGRLEDVVGDVTSGVDFYNILSKIDINELSRSPRQLWKPLGEIDEDAISKIMNTVVRASLGLEREWSFQSSEVFDILQEDFMKPVINIVEKLLNHTDLEVVVYNGQLDLIVDTPGTVKWANKIKWSGAREWKRKIHSPMVVDGIIEGFYKNVGRFTFYWVSRAGHMVPYDNPSGMEFILHKTID